MPTSQPEPVSRPDAPEGSSEAIREPVRRGKNVRGIRTRQLLLDAAQDCFAEYGYAGTRISDVVFRAGVSQGNFYRHFASKDDVFLAALQPGLAALTAATHRARAADHPVTAPTLESLVEQTTVYLTTYARHRHLLRVMREAAASSVDQEFTALWLAQRAGFVERTARWLRRLHDAGLLAEVDAETLADVLGSTIEQTAYVHVGLAAEAPRPERIQQLARTVGEVWFRALPLTPRGAGA